MTYMMNQLLFKVCGDDNDNHTNFMGELLDEEMIYFFIQHKVDLNVTNDDGLTPLHLAAMVDNRRIGKALLKNKANTKLVDPKTGDTVLHTAVRYQHLDFISLLLEFDNTLINTPNNNGDTPLHLAAVNSSVYIIKQLISFGADINYLNNYNQTFLEKAIDENSKHIDMIISMCYN